MTDMDLIDKIVALNTAMHVTAATFCKLTGIQPSNYSQMKRGARPCGMGIANKVCASLGIDARAFAAWDGSTASAPLATTATKATAETSGDRPATPPARPREPNGRAVETAKLGYMDVPFVPIKAHCGYLTGYGDMGYIERLPTIPVLIDRNYRGHYRVFEAAGDSMDNDTRQAICDGDKLLTRELPRDLWLPRIPRRDWYYVIVHRTEGISIKLITDQDDRGNITCHSLNPMFDDYVVNLDDVAELYQVITVIERNMRL